MLLLGGLLTGPLGDFLHSNTHERHLLPRVPIPGTLVASKSGSEHVLPDHEGVGVSAISVVHVFLLDASARLVLTVQKNFPAIVLRILSVLIGPFDCPSCAKESTLVLNHP